MLAHDLLYFALFMLISAIMWQLKLGLLKEGRKLCRAKRYVGTFMKGCQGVRQLGGLVPVIRLGSSVIH